MPSDVAGAKQSIWMDASAALAGAPRIEAGAVQTTKAGK